ncbi:hypothetical protein DPMN_066563 [Dreissena polymorpha]|uniref:Uncharacterized protein n=1 Tax=Dreissena polymorpha TaxID=45954 RepID=A0A9D3YY29_DREPO|nr:hypothetical protein DPMN_066563 [Dreissena polymorpha]
MLLADKFDREMVTKYTGAKVKINIEKHGIEIEGVNSEVKDIQAEMEKRTNTYTKIQKTSPIKLEKIYKSTIVEEYIGHKFEQASVIAVWEADNGKLNVISKTGEMVDKAVAIVQTSVKMCSVQVKAEQKSIIETSKWKELVEQLSIKHHGKLIFDMSEESKIAMLSTVDIHNVVLEAINNFLDTNTKYVEMWHVKANTLQLLTQHHKHDVLQITMGTNVTLTEHKVCFEISGTKHDIESAKRKLDTIVAKIKAQPYSVSKPGISTLWKSQKGRDIQHVVETAHRVILKSTFDKRDDEDHTFDKGAMAGGHHLGCNVIASCTGQGKTMIQVILGDITDLDVDVIIYSANELLDLNSGLGKAILAKGIF